MTTTHVKWTKNDENTKLPLILLLQTIQTTGDEILQPAQSVVGLEKGNLCDSDWARKAQLHIKLFQNLYQTEKNITIHKIYLLFTQQKWRSSTKYSQIYPISHILMNGPNKSQICEHCNHFYKALNQYNESKNTQAIQLMRFIADWSRIKSIERQQINFPWFM